MKIKSKPKKSLVREVEETAKKYLKAKDAKDAAEHEMGYIKEAIVSLVAQNGYNSGKSKILEGLHHQVSVTSRAGTMTIDWAKVKELMPVAYSKSLVRVPSQEKLIEMIKRGMFPEKTFLKCVNQGRPVQAVSVKILCSKQDENNEE